MTANCVTVSGGTVTATSVNNAISSAVNDTYIEIPAGSFSLSDGIQIRRSSVTLRGAGAGTGGTKLTFTNNVGTCSLFYGEVFAVCPNPNVVACTTSCGGSGPDHTATWSAGYSQGTTVVTLSSTTGLTVGMPIYLDQVDDALDGFPATGDIKVCHTSGASGEGCSWEGGGSYYRVEANRSQVEVHKVTAINGSNVTISPGIYSPNYRSGSSPGAYWMDNFVHDVGIENLTAEWGGAGGVGVLLSNCNNCWVTGNRLIYNAAAGNFVISILSINTLHNTYHGNYLYGPLDPAAITNYTYSVMNGSMNLFENNICDRNIVCAAADDPEEGDVFSYNYVINGSGFGALGVQTHQPGDFMNLWEGNDMGTYMNDVIHGTHYFGTLIRNVLSGQTNQPGSDCAESCSGIVLEVFSRFFNLVGNVLGSVDFTVYDYRPTAEFPGNQKDQSAMVLGWRGSHGPSSCSPCPDTIGGSGNDANVARTLFRWGNYDNVNNAVRWNTGEVPSGITNYPNAVPGAQTVPNSLYLSAKPGWWGASAWPAAGPDVTGGSLSNMGGHANKIPARLRFEAGTNDGAYPTSSPRIKIDVTASCPCP